MHFWVRAADVPRPKAPRTRGMRKIRAGVTLVRCCFDVGPADVVLTLFTRRCYDVGPASMTLAQHQNNIG